MSEQTPEPNATETPAAGTTPPAETPTETPKAAPKTFDETYVKRLREEAAGYRTQLREAQTANETTKGELETTKAAAARVPDLERELLRYKVALEKGLPKELVGRLQGDTEEELAADADVVKGFLAPRLPGQGNDGGVRTPLTAPDLDTQIAEAVAKGDIGLSITLKAQKARELSRPRAS